MSIDLTQLATATPTLVLAIGIAVSLLKPILEQTMLPPAAPLHDTAVRILALLTGAIIAVVATLATVPGIVTVAQVLTAIISGGVAALGSIASYHLLTGSYFSDGVPPAIASTVTLSPPPTPTVYVPTVQRVELTHVVAPAPLPPVAEPPALIVPPSTSATPVTPLPLTVAPLATGTATPRTAPPTTPPSLNTSGTVTTPEAQVPGP